MTATPSVRPAVTPNAHKYAVILILPKFGNRHLQRTKQSKIPFLPEPTRRIRFETNSLRTRLLPKAEYRLLSF